MARIATKTIAAAGRMLLWGITLGLLGTGCLPDFPNDAGLRDASMLSGNEPFDDGGADAFPDGTVDVAISQPEGGGTDGPGSDAAPDVGVCTFGRSSFEQCTFAP